MVPENSSTAHTHASANAIMYVNLRHLAGVTAIQAHVTSLSDYLYTQLSHLRHTNGKPMAVVFGKHDRKDRCACRTRGGRRGGEYPDPIQRQSSRVLSQVALVCAAFSTPERQPEVHMRQQRPSSGRNGVLLSSRVAEPYPGVVILTGLILPGRHDALAGTSIPPSECVPPSPHCHTLLEAYRPLTPSMRTPPAHPGRQARGAGRDRQLRAARLGRKPAELPRGACRTAPPALHLTIRFWLLLAQRAPRPACPPPLFPSAPTVQFQQAAGVAGFHIRTVRSLASQLAAAPGRPQRRILPSYRLPLWRLVGRA